MVDASAKLGRAEALRLAKSASKVVVAKGKSIATFDMKRNPPDDETLLGAMLGPTGNLRAPTIRVGGVVLVGFAEAMYGSVLK